MGNSTSLVSCSLGVDCLCARSATIVSGDDVTHSVWMHLVSVETGRDADYSVSPLTLNCELVEATGCVDAARAGGGSAVNSSMSRCPYGTDDYTCVVRECGVTSGGASVGLTRRYAGGFIDLPGFMSCVAIDGSGSSFHGNGAYHDSEV